MIVQKLSWFESFSKERDYTDICNCIGHLAIVSQLILELGTLVEVSDIDSVDILKRIVSCGVSSVEGLSISQDSLATTLLDSGLGNIFFDISDKAEDEVGETLSTFPLNRVGITLRADKDSTIPTVNLYSPICSHFVIR